MTTVPPSIDFRPRPPKPAPRSRPFNAITFIRAIRDNPLTTFSEEHYEAPVSIARTALGTIALVNDPAAIRRLLVENKDNYVRDTFQRGMLGSLVGNSLITCEGAEWRRQRHEVAPLLSPHRVACFEPAMARAAEAMVADLADRGEHAAIDSCLAMKRVSIGVLHRTIFGDGIASEHSEVAANLEVLFDRIGRLDLADVLGIPKWVPRFGVLRTWQTRRFFLEFCSSTLAARRSRLADNPASAPDDLLAILLARDEKGGPVFSDDQIQSNLLLFLFAGFESTAATLTWATYLLAIDPLWRDLVEAEADREMPDGLFPEGGMDRFPAVRAVIEEAMRLYPPVASIHRQALGPDCLGGRDIAKGTLVCVSTWLLHRHRTLWNEPDAFDPARFMPDSRDRVGRYAYLPFGLGPRTCIGANFAMRECVIILATLSRSLRFDMLPGQKVEPLHRVTLRPRSRLMLRVSRRSTRPG